MVRNIISTLVLVGLIFAACASKDDDSNIAYPNAPIHPDPIKIVQLVNEFRAQGETCGKKNFGAANKIVWSDSLAIVAKKHSEDMLANDKLSHTGTDGSFVNDRLRAAGYKYSFYAENLLKGSPSENDAINSWKNSPAHCENLMDPNVREIGVGTAGPYWTMILASRK